MNPVPDVVSLKEVVEKEVPSLILEKLYWVASVMGLGIDL